MFITEHVLVKVECVTVLEGTVAIRNLLYFMGTASFFRQEPKLETFASIY